MTQKELAKKMGVAEMSVSKSINGNPGLSTLEKIAEALGVDVSELFAPSRNVIRCPHCGAVLELKEK